MSPDRLRLDKYASSLKTSWKWWLESLLFAFILAAAPYWILNLLHLDVLVSPWWRVPVAGPGVFDSYMYFNWLAASANDLPYGGIFQWYAVVIKGIWWMLSSWASVPEVWIATRWFSYALLLLVGSWVICTWSGLDRKSSRWLMLSYTFAIALSIGIRPGAYSWYLPFAFLAYGAAAQAVAILEGGRWKQALGWSVLSGFLALLYPWHLMVVGLWLAAIWGRWLFRYHRRAGYLLLMGVVVFVSLLAWKAASWFLAPAQQNGFVGIYERSGITFARVPFFANTVLALGGWIALMLVVGYGCRQKEKWRDRCLRDGGLWITVLLLWFHTPITGIHLYSDHFIGPTIVLSLLSFTTVWQAYREGAWSFSFRDFPLHLRTLLGTIVFGATLFVGYVVQQPLRFHPWKFDAYAVHVLHWLALAAAGWLGACSLFRSSSKVERMVTSVLLGIYIVVGVWGTAAILKRDQSGFIQAQSRVPAIEYLRTSTPVTAHLCADPATASFFAAHTGQRIYPAEAIQAYSVSNEHILSALETLAGAYHVSSSGNVEVYQFETNHYRTLSCAAGSKYSHNGRWYRLLRRVGVSDQRINELVGCRQEVINAQEKRIAAAIARHALDVSSFRRLCPLVLIPDTQRNYWQLPPEYKETRIGDQMGLWSASRPQSGLSD